MRSIGWILAGLSVCGLIWVAGSGPCWGRQPTPPGEVSYEAYGALPCGAPSYGFVPGCCEFPRSCCDNVWAGYCQERHRCWAFPRQRHWRRGPRCLPEMSGSCCDEPTGTPVDLGD